MLNALGNKMIPNGGERKTARVIYFLNFLVKKLLKELENEENAPLFHVTIVAIHNPAIPN